MIKEYNLIFDFDSTFVKVETIEILAKISLQKNNDRHAILDEIEKLTKSAMDGDISFPIALEKRISLINLNKNIIKETIDDINDKITESIMDNNEFIKNNADKCYIISGGFKEIIEPIANKFGINKNHIFANTFIYNNDGDVISIDKKNPLSMENGKSIAAQNIIGKNIIIGDGYTDYELKKNGKAKYFIQYIENINRKNLNKYADYIANNFQDVLKYLYEK